MNWLRWPPRHKEPRSWRIKFFRAGGREYVGLLRKEGYGLVLPVTENVKATVGGGIVGGVCLTAILAAVVLVAGLFWLTS